MILITTVDQDFEDEFWHQYSSNGVHYQHVFFFNILAIWRKKFRLGVLNYANSTMTAYWTNFCTDWKWSGILLIFEDNDEFCIISR